jgi:predicted transcriptional regulator
MVERSRRRHPYAGKLSLEDAVCIRARHAAGEPARRLADEYGVTPASVHAVLRREAHPSTLLVDVEDTTYTALAATAASAGSSPEAVAAQLIERGISKRKEAGDGGRNDNGRSRSKRRLGSREED